MKEGSLFLKITGVSDNFPNQAGIHQRAAVWKKAKDVLSAGNRFAKKRCYRAFKKKRERGIPMKTTIYKASNEKYIEGGTEWKEENS